MALIQTVSSAEVPSTPRGAPSGEGADNAPGLLEAFSPTAGDPANRNTSAESATGSPSAACGWEGTADPRPAPAGRSRRDTVNRSGFHVSRVTDSGRRVSVGLLVKGAVRGTSFCFLC